MYLKINPIVAEEAAEKLGFSSKTDEKRSSVAKAIVDLIGFARGVKPPSPSALSFSAACKAPIHFVSFTARLKSCPDASCISR
jgi:hypothetical protein